MWSLKSLLTWQRGEGELSTEVLPCTWLSGLIESAYIRIVANKAGSLLKYYPVIQNNIKGFVDQANNWNAHPKLPESARDIVTFLQNDDTGSLFLVNREINVQGCHKGDGYGSARGILEPMGNPYHSCRMQPWMPSDEWNSVLYSKGLSPDYSARILNNICHVEIPVVGKRQKLAWRYISMQLVKLCRVTDAR